VDFRNFGRRSNKSKKSALPNAPHEYRFAEAFSITLGENHMYFRTLAVTVGVSCLLGYPGWTVSAEDLPTAVTAKREMVVTANPLATEAAAFILKIGGTATDAMIAAQTVLGLVEPQSTGLAGGAFIVYYDARTGKTTTLDAREKAAAAAKTGLPASALPPPGRAVCRSVYPACRG
jgi:hypothetical protein